MRSALGGRPTGGGLHTQKHVDQGSLVTIDILLSDPAEIEGGVLQTLEADGALLPHAWEQWRRVSSSSRTSTTASPSSTGGTAAGRWCASSGCPPRTGRRRAT